jgi:hypothetical protein
VVRADIDLEALSQQQQQQQQQPQQPQQEPGAPKRQQPKAHPLSAAGGAGAGGVEEAPDWAAPSGTWVRQFVASFQELRQRVAEVYESGGERLGTAAQWKSCAARAPAAEALRSKGPRR